jgi:hypothetical protein
VRQSCGATASNEAKIHDDAVHHRKERLRGRREKGGCGAHDGAMVESWPTRWRGVRRRGRGSRRRSPPRLQLLVPG